MHQEIRIHISVRPDTFLGYEGLTLIGTSANDHQEGSDILAQDFRHLL